MFSRVSEYLAEVVKADAGYNGVLSHNPIVSDPGQNLRTEWLREEPYPLVALAEVIPFGWRAPTVPKTAIVRNEAMFRALLKWTQSGQPGSRGPDGGHVDLSGYHRGVSGRRSCLRGV